MTRHIPLTARDEPGAGARLGGLYRGPTQGENLRLWDGRPPQQDDYWGPRTLVVSLRADPEPATAVRAVGTRSVTIDCTASMGWGAKIRREFQIGEGLSVAMNIGTYKIVSAIVTTAVPDGMVVYFAWSDLPATSTSVPYYTAFVDYPTAAQRIALPEGTDEIAFDIAGTITWTLTQFGTTFVQVVAAGQMVPALWGTLTFNQNNAQIMARLRPF